ncbi:glycoside hydrolase family 65 protein [Nitrospirillum sp. BR 11163]|uniref:glycoside hydrolase family 65 protein n=1 Tax=Nitrospirillum sp. BR 11163 TaxID=3104323 RepID=UPI002AFE3123|nr:glycosyl hydrolase family 65 protein [Nitrospirillum sp. BR 11163]MEA1672424.1 glycosyl hydrolase family 65 protein [Nitrospirillum sp. BR 11163]
MTASLSPFPAIPSATDPWVVIARGDSPAALKCTESLFTLGNGFIGVRGGVEEDARSTAPVVHLNGVYEITPITYHEKAPGFAEASDTRIPVPDGTLIGLTVEGEPLDLSTGTVLEHHRWLDLRTGVLHRALRWRSPAGRTLRLATERLVVEDHPGPVVIQYQVTAEDFTAEVVVDSCLAPHQPPSMDEGGVHDPRVGPQLAALAFRRWIEEDGNDGMVLRTSRSRQGVAVAMSHGATVTSDAPILTASIRDQGIVSHTVRTTLTPGSVLTLVKCVAYAADKGVDGTPADDEVLARSAVAALAQANAIGLPALRQARTQALQDFWLSSDIAVEGAPDLERAVRFNLFQLLQGAGRDGLTSVGAKGQSGEGYEGHYFWDAEIFALPILVYTRPAVARAILEYRHRTLDGARAHARAMGHRKGALYPWRTIGGGECSAYFPAGSAQYHINADIAHAVRQYMDASGDDDFLVRHGAEILFETARLWLDMGHYNPRRGGRFCIHEVTGPDEYTAMVDNNLYTNAMAQAHLEYAAEVAARLGREKPEALARIAAAIGLGAEEPEGWRQAAQAMYLPYDEASGIYPQDDSFLDKKPWDFAGTPADHHPLLLHYHPLVLYRHQVCKQADAVLAFCLLPHRFEPEAVRRSFAFYESVTVHDSTLSAGVFALLAARLGQLDKALAYFNDTALVDLDDLHRNTGHGLHMAAMAGSWMALAQGFAGLHALGGTLRFTPTLPPGWTGYRFRLDFQGNRIEVAVGCDAATTYRLLTGPGLALNHHGQVAHLTPSAPEQTLRTEGTRHAAL